MPRGGRRPGAGAPRGNTNALKNGRYSQRVVVLEDILEDLSRHAYLIGLVAGPRQAAMQQIAFALQLDADALLKALLGVTGRSGSIKQFLRFPDRRSGRPSGSRVSR